MKKSLAVWMFAILSLSLYVAAVVSHKPTLGENLSNVMTGVGILLAFSVVMALFIHQKAKVQK